MKTIFFIASMIFTAALYGQCDTHTYEKLLTTKPSFSLLKRYSIPIREIEDAPFAVQYSYVLTKNSIYSFYLKQTDGPTPIVFTLTNSHDQVVDCETLENFGKEGVMFGYTPDKTDVYYLNLYSSQSKKGCVTLQLSFHRPPLQVASAVEEKRAPEKFPKVPILEKTKELKKFEISPNSSSRYAFALKESKIYGLSFPSQNSADHIRVQVKSYSGQEIKGKMALRADGLVFIFRPEETDLHYFSFTNSNSSEVLVARLIELFPDRVGVE